MPAPLEYDVVVVGAGPAGLQAAIHAARRRRSVLVLGKEEGSALSRGHVANLFGASATAGTELLRRGRDQAREAGAELVAEDAVALRTDAGHLIAVLESRREALARALVLATGAAVNRLGVPGEKELTGRGVSYCVDCDGPLFRGKPVAVAGGGSAAVEGALLLLKYASAVHLVAERLDVSGPLRQELESSGVVRHVPDRIVRIAGAGTVEAVELERGGRLAVGGVFIELGAKGMLSLAGSLGIALDEENQRYVVTDKAQRTNVPGVFAAGDCCGPPFQVAKAIGEGCVAGLGAAEHAKASDQARA